MHVETQPNKRKPITLKKVIASFALWKKPRAEQILAKCHNSCDTILLDTFIQIFCDGKFELLIISGRPSENEVLSAWENILNEYVDIVGNAASEHIIVLQKKINVIKCRMHIVELAVTGLSICYDKKFIDGLNQCGYPCKLTAENWEELRMKELQSIISRSKTLNVELEPLEKQLERLQKPKKNKPVTKEDFEQDIVMLSKHQGYRIDKKKTTMSEYAAIYSSFVYFCKKREEQENARANKSTR